MKDKIENIIQTADTSDWQRAVYSQPEALVNFLNSFLANVNETVIKDPKERERFLDVCMQIMTGANNDIQKRTAIMVVISFYDNMLRSLLKVEINKVISTYDVNVLKQRMMDVIVMETQLGTLKKRMDTLKIELTDLEKDVKHKSENRSMTSYIASLKYAADKWGTPTEKKYVSTLVKKIDVQKEKVIMK